MFLLFPSGLSCVSLGAVLPESFFYFSIVLPHAQLSVFSLCLHLIVGVSAVLPLSQGQVFAACYLGLSDIMAVIGSFSVVLLPRPSWAGLVSLSLGIGAVFSRGPALHHVFSLTFFFFHKYICILEA